MRPIVLDACALLAFLRRERGGDRVAAWLREAGRGDRRLLLHRLHLGEILYRSGAGLAGEEATRLLARLRRLPLETEGPLGFDLLRAAARLKTRHRVPYVDALAGAWALHNEALLATTDRTAFAPAAEAGALEVTFLR